PLLLTLGLTSQGLAAPPIRYNFDHLTTGFELVGQHRDLPCEACHANAIFKGTPKDCGACHGVGTTVRATAKPANHILSTDQCGSCHTPVGWNPAVNFDHTQARGSCSTCHETGNYQEMHPSTNTAAGDSRPPTALDRLHPATGDCGQCHNTTSFLDPTTPRPSNHIPTTALCSQWSECGSTGAAWLGQGRRSCYDTGRNLPWRGAGDRAPSAVLNRRRPCWCSGASPGSCPSRGRSSSCRAPGCGRS